MRVINTCNTCSIITCVQFSFFFLISSHLNLDTKTTTALSNTSSIIPICTKTPINSTPTTTAKQQLRRSTFPYVKIDPAVRRYKRIHKERQDSRFPEVDNVFHREEDVLLCLQLLAYLSKYPHIRDLFNTAYAKNVFNVVEKFCHRAHPGSIQYWAGVIMRNACRKDDTRGGRRRCANMSCGQWETTPREFAKCRRCRKAKYCSKACQSKAWADGHRWWCVERHSTIVRDTGVHQQNLNAIIAADRANQPQGVQPPQEQETEENHHHHHHSSETTEQPTQQPTTLLMEMAGVHMEL